MKCWNCLGKVLPQDPSCPSCGQAIKPNSDQTVAAKGQLNYLLSESSEWAFLPPEICRELSLIYLAKGERLQQVADGLDGANWPESDWGSPFWLGLKSQLLDAPAEAPTAEAPADKTPTMKKPRPVGLPAPGPLPSPAQDKRLGEPSMPLRASLSSKVLAEADIRWFHSLGALLVVAAVIGWLRATWDGYGKNLAGMMILASPLALHAFARQLRQTVPLSARLLSILAGLLIAPALLAAEVFDFLPPQVSGRDYWTFAFLVAASLLGWQAHVMKERVPLYVGTLCAVMAGWSQGALATSALCLMVGFLLAPVKTSEQDDEKARAWANDLQKIGFAAGLFGCFSALFLFHPERALGTPLLLFSAALVYLHLPTLTRDPDAGSQSRVSLQAAMTVLGMLLMRWVLDLPASGVGLYAMLAAGLFLAARPEDKAGLRALKIGGWLGLLGLAIGLFGGSPLLQGEHDPDPVQTAARFALALLGAGLFGWLSRQIHLESQRKTLGLTAMLSTFGGAYHLFYLLAEAPRHAFIIAGFGLWSVLWLFATRWLRAYEKNLVLAVSAPVLLVCSGCALVAGAADGLPSWRWAKVAVWLGSIAWLWQKGLLARPLLDGDEDKKLHRILGLGLPRLALWTLALAMVLAGLVTSHDAPLALQILGLGLLLAPENAYRRPGLEMVWLAAPAALSQWWSPDPLPGQLLPMLLVICSAWAAPGRLRPACLGLSALWGLAVLISSLSSASGWALACLPVAYALACALPAPGRDWVDAGAARYGFDAHLCAAIFLPLNLAPRSAASLVLTVAIPLLALAAGRAKRLHGAERVLTPTTAHSLILSAFVWSLFQGPQEAGLLLLSGSLWALTLKDPAARDLANGMALLGACWISSPALHEPNLAVLAAATLLSEAVALVRGSLWQPNYSNSTCLIILTLQQLRPMGELELALSISAGTLALLRGLSTGHAGLAGVGAFTALKLLDGELSAIDPSLKVRVVPAALILLGIGPWLSLQPDHPSRDKLKLPPLACLRTGVALLCLPALLSLAVRAELQDFAWVLCVGCACLVASSIFSSRRELALQLRQLGGWVLTGWAVVSLGRAAMKLPWQLATLVVGLALVALGVVVERRRFR